MGKNKLLKWIIPLSLGALLLGVGYKEAKPFVHASTPSITSQTRVSSSMGEKVTINDPLIKQFLMKTFNKDYKDSFYSKEFKRCYISKK